jgi:hypothetical protein
MLDDFKTGDLVFLTKVYDDYFHEKNPTAITVILTNRIAKIEDIIDWSSEKGKLIKEARLKTNKWNNLPLEDNKYILSIYFHDLVGRKGQKGVVQRGTPMFSGHPQTHEPFFIKAPDWLFKEIAKKCESFNVYKKD